ncbi:Nucleoporin [Astathelohania contejeani]|uniref:Nucleoporin n=1 Tax=Astathelohania contejeani TaxID=164912 RepID=A0ABQ7HXR4_9MICR|nr:Nucleoporin [Thelohania contejeani]
MDQNNNPTNLFNGQFFQSTPQKSTSTSNPQQTGFSWSNTNSPASKPSYSLLQPLGSQQSNPFNSNLQTGSLPPLGGSGSLLGSGSNTLGGGASSLGSGMPSLGSGVPSLGSGIPSLGSTGSSLGTSNTVLGSVNTLGGTSTLGTQPIGQLSTPLGTQLTNPLGSQSTFGGTNLNQPSSNLFQSNFSNTQPWGAARKGSKDTPFKSHRVRDDNGLYYTANHLGFISDYTKKSTEEIRSEDYELGRKPMASKSFSLGQSFNQSFTPQISQQSPFTTSQPAFTTQSTTQQSFNPLSNQATLNLTTAPTFNTPSNTTSFNGSSLNPPSTTPHSTSNLNAPSLSTSTFNTTNQNTAQNSFSQTPFNQSTAQPSYNTTPFSQSTAQQIQPPFNQTPEYKNPFQSFNTPSTNQSYTSNATLNPITNYSSNNTGLTANQPFNTQTATSTSQTTTQPTVDYSDPYLIKGIKFEKVEPIKHSYKRIEYMDPIFEDEPIQKTEHIDLKLRAPKPRHRGHIYTIPSLEEVIHMREVNHLNIIFEGKGKIEYLDPVDVECIKIENIESKVFFDDPAVSIGVSINDMIGTGLNKRARVYIEKCYPYSKSLGGFITTRSEEFPLMGIQEKYIYELKKDKTRRFVDYDYERGLYVYEINHF